ncbi:L-galactonate transporter [compost metagenome]
MHQTVRPAKPPASLGPTDWPTPTRAWVTVFVLMAAYALAFVDRQILTLLVEPVRRDLNITDTQFSLLSGLAFTLFYTVMGIPFAWVADRSSRRGLIVFSLMFWSVMTAACGAAGSFATLFLARIGVGVGEAGLSPAAYSMIADSFPQARRARPLGVYAIGSIAGVGMALIIGGAVIQWAISAPPVVVPLLGELKSWQLAFLIVSLPGPILALALLLIREPKRQEKPLAEGETGLSLVAFLRRRWKPFTLLSLGYALISVAIAAYLTWTPTFMARSYGWEMGRIGATYGVILLVFCTVGVLLGGWWADHMATRGVKDAVLRVAIAGSVLALPFAVAAPFAPDGVTAMAAVTCLSFGFGLAQGLPAPTLQAIAPNRLRARVMALYLLIGNIVAFTVGPTGVALISDYWLKDSAKIGMAVGIISGVVIPLGCLTLWAARKSFIEASAAEAEL